MDKIYLIATYEGEPDEGGWPIEQGRIPGYFITQQGAIDAVEKNKFDIHENCYTYAVIEGIAPGLYQEDFNPIFYKWIDGKYQRIERPEIIDPCIIGFTIG